ncbi:MAG: hypothetical protein JWQ07_984 [Ramlibacter sp.]|nr:hypothetical protein [Ramlibacter sp.]
MRHSTIHHPALLGRGNRFAREAARIGSHARSPGLFDLPVDANGLHGQTAGEREAVRAFQMLGEAFGLWGAALSEWHRVFAREELPRADGPLLREGRAVLPDLLLRAQTLALYQNRDGRGACFMRVWRRAKPLRQLLDARARLHAELRVHAPHLAVFADVLQDELASQPMGGLRDLRREWLAAGLTAAGWRWIVRNRLPDSPYEPGSLAALGWSISLVNALAELGPAFVPDDLFSAYVGQFAEEVTDANEMLEGSGWLLESAWRHYERIDTKADRDYFMLSIFRRAAFWAIRRGWLPDVNQRRAGWGAIERAWRRETGRVPGPLVEWPVPFDYLEWGAMLAVPISNSQDLWTEGAAMRHCIADYVSRCVAGEFLALSVRGPGGERVATMSFHHASDGHRWHWGDCKGRFNRDVCDRGVYALMDEVRATLRDWSG